MKSKAPLATMEQMVMMLVFALAAALCLQTFVASDGMSKDAQARDRAVTLCQNAAEAIRHTGGDFQQAAEMLGCVLQEDEYYQDYFIADYNADWSLTEDGPRYTLSACRLESEAPGLGKASIWVKDEAAEAELFRIETAWQEVAGNG